MAAYRADIEIAVRGAAQISALQKELNATSIAVNQVNRTLGLRGVLVNSVDNLNRAASQASAALRSAASGTNAQKQALDVYVRSLAAAEKAELELTAAITKRRKELGLAQATTTRGPQGGAGGGIGSRVGGAVSSAVIGGAFPLLFGQSTEAAVGGAVGGLLGGAGGGFAGSLLGTALGEIAAKQNIVKDLAADLGLAATQTEILATAFQQAGKNTEQFQAAVVKVQGLGLALEDQVSVIQLASRLTGEYGGSVEKVTSIYADFISKGKVGISDLTKLTAQGIPIQQALADKFGVSRTKVLDLAKDGEISVQQLSDTLTELGNNVDGQTGKAETGFDRFKKAVESVATEIVALARSLAEVLGPALDAILSKIASGLSGLNQLISNEASRNLGKAGLALTFGFESQGIDNLKAALTELSSVTPQSQKELDLLNRQLTDVANNLRRVGPQGANAGLAVALQGRVLEQQRRLQAFTFGAANTQIQRINTPSNLPPSGGGRKGKRPPQLPDSRETELLARLQATIEIGEAEDRIRDLRFQERDAAVVQAELEKTLSDITRDRITELERANFAGERAAIIANAVAREENARLLAADQLREVEFERVQTAIDEKNALAEAVQPIKDIALQQKAQLQDAKLFNRLVSEGILPAEAERLVNFERLVAAQTQSIDLEVQLKETRATELEDQVKLLEAKEAQTDEVLAEIQARGLSINKIREEIDALRARRDAIIGAAAGGPGAAPTNRERLQNEIGQLQGQLNQLVDPVNQLVIGAQAIGDAFAQSFRDIISGTVPVQQALSNFFGQIASSFLDNAAQIIAAQLQIFVLQRLLGFIGGAVGGGFSFGGAGPLSGASVFGAGQAGFNPAAFGGASLFAEGGFVTGPTNAIIGEGGEAEYVIPASKMNAAMARYSKGVRGEAVVGGEGGSAQAAAGSAGPMEPIDVRYSVERINNVDYVTADQFQRGLAQAAQQGAVQGERRALRTLSNSPANRRRIGL